MSATCSTTCRPPRRVCRELEELDVFFFETPFPVDSPVPYAELAARTSIPLAMGEHGVTRWEFLDMMDRGRVSVVQPYMTTCGGLTEAKRIVELARAAGRWSARELVHADPRRRDGPPGGLLADHAVHRVRPGRGLRLAAAPGTPGRRVPGPRRRDFAPATAPGSATICPPTSPGALR